MLHMHNQVDVHAACMHVSVAGLREGGGGGALQDPGSAKSSFAR